MTVKMLIFDYKEAEKDFFKKNSFEDFDLEFYTDSLNEITVNNLPDEIKDEAVVISVFVTSEINKNIIKSFKNLQIIATRSTGYDHIDISACCKRNIRVLNVENYASQSVVQYTFCLIFALIRHLKTAIKDTEYFNFCYNNYVGNELNALTIGVIGTGSIGTQVCKVANSFGMNILAYDIAQNKELSENYNVSYVDKRTLISQADIVSLHIPLNEQTKHSITKYDFALMKPSAYLVNVSRGEIVNTFDLYNALVTKSIAGVALDVIECENVGFANGNIAEKLKNIDKDCIANLILARRLTQMENVILTPHIAYSTKESINGILSTMFNSIKDNIKGEHTNQIN